MYNHSSFIVWTSIATMRIPDPSIHYPYQLNTPSQLSLGERQVYTLERDISTNY